MNNLMDFDHIFKVVIVGQANVGKTSLLSRYVDSTFPEEHYSTIGVEHKVKTLQIDGKLVKLQMWDTAGQERFQSLAVNYFRGAQAAMLVFALDDCKSFQKLSSWIDIADEKQIGYKILVGNKCDLEPKAVSIEIIRAFLDERRDIRYVEVSAKTGQSVDDAFITMASELLKRMQRQQEIDKDLVKLEERQIGVNECESRTGNRCCGGTG